MSKIATKLGTALKQPASWGPDRAKALQPTSLKQPTLYEGLLELAHRRVHVFHCIAIYIVAISST